MLPLAVLNANNRRLRGNNLANSFLISMLSRKRFVELAIRILFGSLFGTSTPSVVLGLSEKDRLVFRASEKLRSLRPGSAVDSYLCVTSVLYSNVWRWVLIQPSTNSVFIDLSSTLVAGGGTDVTIQEPTGPYCGQGI